MKVLGILVSALFLLGCSADDDKSINGKWYTYAESGDYMELWISDDKAMTYLSGIDEFLLYELKQERNTLSFSLIESRITDEHQFTLEVKESNDELFQAVFIGSDRVDSLKTYFLVSNEVPSLGSSLEANKQNRIELIRGMQDR